MKPCQKKGGEGEQHLFNQKYNQQTSSCSLFTFF
ncbi:MAG: hypothetical protein ACI90V_013712, partial [Bacillariaceae sp.]